MIRRFDSLAAYADALGTPSPYFPKAHDWALGVTPTEALARTREGDPSCVASVTDALDGFACEASDEARMRYVSDVAGTRVCVPAFLANNPMCMRKRVKRESVARHVSVYVGLVASAIVRASDLQARGCAVLGLLEALQAQGVAVDLFLVCDTHGRTDGDFTQVIRVESRPLDVSTAGFAIAHPAFYRHLAYGYAEREDNFNGRWSRSFERCGAIGDAKRHTPHMREQLGMSETDVYVEPVVAQDNLIKDPRAWIRARVAQAMGVQAA